MKYLVSGGSGFVASNFIELIYEKDPAAEVVNIDCMKIGASEKNTLSFANRVGYRHYKANINQINQINLKQPDIIINFAAESHVDRSIQHPIEFVESNTLGMGMLLEYAHTRKVPFIQISTDEVYGEIKEGYATETSHLKPGNPYSASKAGADLLALAYVRTYGANIKITRCCNNYGPHQYPEKMIPAFLQKLMKNEKVPVYGNGMQRREWIHVKDHCEAIWTVLKSGVVGEVYNIGTGVEMANIDVTRKLIQALGLNENYIEYVQDRPGHDTRYALDSSKIRALGWTPKKSFEEGIAETISYYHKRGFKP